VKVFLGRDRSANGPVYRWYERLMLWLVTTALVSSVIYGCAVSDLKLEVKKAIVHPQLSPSSVMGLDATSTNRP